MSQYRNTNKLIEETSPYLLQHAHNPVNWYPWGKEALNKAKAEDKPILVSIGYSACHWCHVMERESFEQGPIAQIMNENFVCIKVDREERPDVDQIYMDAVQAMGIQGGWPLNVFLTPEQKPFYGGTYFPPQHWGQLLQNVAQAFKQNRKELEGSADKFTASLSVSEVIKYGLNDSIASYTDQDLAEVYHKFSQSFDKKKGGMKRAPKFPMPSNWQFLLHYYALNFNKEALKQLNTTLDEMQRGGIYDQIGGGFARYSVDEEWLVPHFEKMLYDNGQLVSLFAKAYQLTKKKQYKHTVYQTINFMEREMMNDEGGFFSALDADSEGEEGKFYVWGKKEIQDILGDESNLFINYYNISEEGNWENGKNILHVKQSLEDYAEKHNIDPGKLEKSLNKAMDKLLAARSKRVRPGLDDKVLTSWNGMMLKGITDAYAAFGDKQYLNLALKNAGFIEKKLKNGDKLRRTYKDGKASINGYLSDYAFVIQAYLSLYQVTFDEQWVLKAKKLTEYTIKHFYDEKEELFFYTDMNAEKLIARKKEIFDNVIPSSNSVMAINLHYLALLMGMKTFDDMARKMIAKVIKLLRLEPGYLSNWATYLTLLLEPTAEIAIVGPEADKFRGLIDKRFYPNKILTGTKGQSDLPLLENRIAIDEKTTIYVCYNKTCKKPVQSVEEAFAQLA